MTVPKFAVNQSEDVPSAYPVMSRHRTDVTTIPWSHVKSGYNI